MSPIVSLMLSVAATQMLHLVWRDSVLRATCAAEVNIAPNGLLSSDT